MQEINIYKTSQNNFPKTFTKLIESIVSQNKKIYLLCENHEEEKKFDNLLWSFSQLSFIPHATTTDPYPSDQLILLGSDPYIKPGNDPEILLTVDEKEYFDDKDIVQFLINQYKKFLFFNVFKENFQENEVQTKNLLFKQAINLGIPINVIEQDTNRKWIKHTL